MEIIKLVSKTLVKERLDLEFKKEGYNFISKNKKNENQLIYLNGLSAILVDVEVVNEEIIKVLDLHFYTNTDED